MAIKLYPDARERVTVYLRADEALAGANPPDVLEHYERTGDASALVVPQDAARFVIHPLNASALSQAGRDAGDLPFDALQVSRRVEARLKAEPGDDIDAARARLMVEEGLTAAHWGPLQAWSEARALALCSLALVECDAWPEVRPASVRGVERFPAALLDRLPMDARMELAAHVERISALGAEGKASPSSRSGAPEPGSPRPGAAPTAPPKCDAPAASAAVPSLASS